MKTKLASVIISIAAVSLFFATTQSSDAVTYSGHDGSVDKYLYKVKVEPYKGKKDLWIYIVKACATDRVLAIAGITLKSDIDTQTLGVNKNIRQGDCSHYGAVMKAKNGNTLGAELIEKHETINKMQQILVDMPKMNKIQKQLAIKEYSEMVQMTGFILR